MDLFYTVTNKKLNRSQGTLKIYLNKMCDVCEISDIPPRK